MILNYVEEIKSKYFDHMYENNEKYEDEMHGWLTHCYLLLDALIIDETFENCMHVDDTELED